VKLVAGIDIGNSTTEIVIADASVDPPAVVATERAPTRGLKGSAESGRAAAQLLARACRRLGLDVERTFLTPQRPVHTSRVDVPPEVPDLGRLTVISRGASTPAGAGVGVGRPVPVDEAATSLEGAAVVLVASDPLGYRTTATAVLRWQSAGANVVGLLLAGDEAALVAARTEFDVPIVDSVNSSDALECDLIALEVAAPGQLVATLTDSVWLAHALGLTEDESGHARSAAALTRSHRDAVIGRVADMSRQRARPTPDRGSITLRDSTELPLTAARSALASTPPPSVLALRAPGGPLMAADDLWLVDLTDTSALPGVRVGSVADTALVVSALAADAASDAGIDAFREEWPGAVDVVADEATASRRGALSTPGASGQSWVIDLGGGTVDAVGPHGQTITAAGSGELMTAATSHALGISSGAAEWVKRGPASRVEAPHVMSDESGERRFLDAAAPHGTVGWLVVTGPSGSLPFSRTLPLAEWRTVRLSLKRQVFSDNVVRMLTGPSLSARPESVIFTGGPAGDDELLETLTPAFGNASVGRARVAGTLDHRWAVAYGLVLVGVEQSA